VSIVYGVAQQVPTIALKIKKHGHGPVGFDAWYCEEFNSCGDHASVCCREIVDVEKKSDASRDPALRATIIRERRDIFDEAKLQPVDKESNRGIIVAHDQRDEFQMGHGSR